MPYGEIPFDRSRLDVLRELLTKLEAQGFHGVVKITNLAGTILSQSATARMDTRLRRLRCPVSRCDLIGNPFDESLSGQQRAVAGIREFGCGRAPAHRGRDHGRDRKRGHRARAGTPYPARSDTLTAGEWNRAAAANNRVEFSAEGSP